MKKATAILFGVLYFILALNLDVNAHVCCGSISDIEVFAENTPSDESCICSRISKEDCCNDIRIKADFKTLSTKASAIQYDLSFAKSLSADFYISHKKFEPLNPASHSLLSNPSVTQNGIPSLGLLLLASAIMRF